MRFLCVVLFLQISNKAHLKAVDVLDVSKDDLQLVVIKHVHTLPALAQVALQTTQVTSTVMLLLHYHQLSNSVTAVVNEALALWEKI